LILRCVVISWSRRMQCASGKPSTAERVLNSQSCMV
jgi:hypothetical protein